MSDVCGHCGQRMLVRHGVRLSPKLCDILDAIERAGERGLTSEVLSWMFYPAASKRDAQKAVAVSINHLNDLLVETDVRVSCGGKLEPYRLVREATC